MLICDINYYAAWFTIFGVIVNVFLTGIVIYIMIKDKQKTKSLRELEQQTDSMQKSFIELIKPTLMILSFETASPVYFSFRIQNIGSSCIDLQLLPLDAEIRIKELDKINGESFSANSIIPCLINHVNDSNKNTSFQFDKKYNVNASYKDIEGRQYQQTLVLIKNQSALQNRIFFTAPKRTI